MNKLLIYIYILFNLSLSITLLAVDDNRVLLHTELEPYALKTDLTDSVKDLASTNWVMTRGFVTPEGGTVTNLTVLDKFSHGASSTPVDEGSFASGLDTYAGSIGWMVKVFDHHNKCLYLTKTPITNSLEQMYFVKPDGSNPITIVNDPSDEVVSNGYVYLETDIQVPSEYLPAWLSINQDSHSDYEAIATNYFNGILYYTGELTQLKNLGKIQAHADTKNVDMGGVKLLIEVQRDTNNNVTANTANVLDYVNSDGSVFTVQTGGSIANESTNYVGTHVLNWYSTVFGRRNYSLGNFSLVSGDMNSALGDYAQISGKRNQAGYMAHAEGNYNRALGFYSHAEGEKNIARGLASHAEGQNNIATGSGSHVDGQFSTASNNYSYVWSGNAATSVESRYGSHGAGTYNINPVGGTKGFYIGNTPLSDIANVDTNVVKEVIYNSAYVRGQQGVTTNGFKYVKLDYYDEATDFDGGLHIYVNTNDTDVAFSIPINKDNSAEIYKATTIDKKLEELRVQCILDFVEILNNTTDGNADSLIVNRDFVNQYIDSITNHTTSVNSTSSSHSQHTFGSAVPGDGWPVNDDDNSENIDNPISGT